MFLEVLYRSYFPNGDKNGSHSMQQQQKRKNIEYNFLKICRYLNLVKNQRTILYKFKICMKKYVIFVELCLKRIPLPEL